MVVEGVYSTRSALALGEKYQVCLPIIEQVYEVIFCGKNVQQAVTELMERDPKAEVEAACWSKLFGELSLTGCFSNVRIVLAYNMLYE